jgi:hypothetical protein
MDSISTSYMAIPTKSISFDGAGEACEKKWSVSPHNQGGGCSHQHERERASERERMLVCVCEREREREKEI